MKTMMILDRQFEDEIMSNLSIAQQQYDACWEVYNSQPLFGGSIKSTIRLIHEALDIVTEPILVKWLRDYEEIIRSK